MQEDVLQGARGGTIQMAMRQGAGSTGVTRPMFGKPACHVASWKELCLYSSFLNLIWVISSCRPNWLRAEEGVECRFEVFILYWDCRFRKKIRSSSIFKNIEVVFHIQSSWVKKDCIPKINFLCCLEQNLGCLPFEKKIEVVFLFQHIEVIFHISSSWIKIRRHTKKSAS